MTIDVAGIIADGVVDAQEAADLEKDLYDDGVIAESTVCHESLINFVATC